MVMAPLLPDRVVTVQIARPADATADLEVSIQAAGRGSRNIADLQVDEIAKSLPTKDRAIWLEQARQWFDGLRRPVLRVVLFHEQETGGTLHRNRVLVSTSDIPPEVDAEILPDGTGLNLTWIGEQKLRIPQCRQQDLGAGLYVCYIEEVDRRMPSTYSSEPITPVEMFGPSHDERFVVSGPRFNARIPFMSVPRPS